MRRSIWLGLGAAALTSVLIVFGASVYLHMEPLPSADQTRQRHRHAERLSDVPFLKNLPAIEPMKIEQALILEQIGGLVPGRQEGSKTWRPPDEASEFVPQMSFRVEYGAEKDIDPPVVIVQGQQFPNDAWPLYFAKWSPNPDFLREENLI